MRRIFSGDGGGMKGLIIAKFLDMAPYRVPDFPSLDDFDLFAGTSTGGILALGLEFGLTPAEMVRYYRERGPEIFPKGPKRARWIKRDRYDVRGLETSLRGTLGNVKLNQASRALLIPALDWNAPERQDCVFFFDETSDYTYFDAARATSAAPTYFKAYELGEHRFVDGGICCNNPSVAAVTHARKLWPDEEIEIYSIGTGREPGHERHYPFTALGLLDDVFDLAISGSAGIAHAELKHDPSVYYVRYDFGFQRAVAMDDARPETLDRFEGLARYPVIRADTRRKGRS